MKLVATACFLALLGCPSPPLPPPDLSGDAGPDACIRACTSLAAAGCPEGRSSPGGLSCDDVCAIAPALLPLACVAESVADVDKIRACGVRCDR